MRLVAATVWFEIVTPPVQALRHHVLKAAAPPLPKQPQTGSCAADQDAYRKAANAYSRYESLHRNLLQMLSRAKEIGIGLGVQARSAHLPATTAVCSIAASLAGLRGGPSARGAPRRRRGASRGHRPGAGATPCSNMWHTKLDARTPGTHNPQIIARTAERFTCLSLVLVFADALDALHFHAEVSDDLRPRVRSAQRTQHSKAPAHTPAHTHSRPRTVWQLFNSTDGGACVLSEVSRLLERLGDQHAPPHAR